MTHLRHFLHSFTMSSKSSAVAAGSVSVYVCHNPECTSRRTSFANEKAFTMHCQRYPTCLDFIHHAVRGSANSTTTAQSIEVPDDNATPVQYPIVTSLKRAHLLRREVINGPHLGDDTGMEFAL